MEQLQLFAEAQQTTILQLSKKIQKLEDENKQLKSSVPIIKTQVDNIQQFGENDSEYICTLEISKLKNVSLERELTYEEAKRLEIYFRLLNQLNLTSKKVEKEVKNISTDELLKLVDNKK